MKRECVKIFLTFLLVLFLISGVFAVEAGTCGIVAKADCDDIATEGHIVMGLSSSTNAHGQFPYLDYPYVLCCNFGTGTTTCTEENKIIRLSSATNAHAEEPAQINYLTKACYEDLICRKSSTCDTDEIGILSLSSDTNAHISSFSDSNYLTKICCGGEAITHASCRITSASWMTTEALEGQNVHLQIQGNGDACIGQTLNFEVSGGDEEATNQPSSVAFSSTSVLAVWTAEHQKCGIWPLQRDCDYSFEATLENNPSVSYLSDEPNLVVRERDEDDCFGVNSCSDYDNQEDCESDESVCDVAINSNPDIDCDNEFFYCGCEWDDEAEGTEEDPNCKFGYVEIIEDDCGSPIEGGGCEFGCTLCHNSEGNYCHVGASCPVGENPLTNNNDSCDFGIDGCVSADCHDGNKDTCATGTYCLSGKCGNVEKPSLTLGSCRITQQIIKGCDEEPVGYKQVTLTAEWDGELSGTQYENCISKDGQIIEIPCPAQVQLPFFNWIGVVSTLLLIAVIYLVLTKKKHHKKSSK